MRVLHVFDLGEVGGLFRVVEGLSIAQRRAGVEVAVTPVVGPGGVDHPLLMRIRNAGVPVHPVVLPPRAYLRERRMVRDLLLELGTDVLHTHGYRSDVIDGPVGRRAGVATVSTSHGFVGGSGKNRMFERLQVRSQRRLDAIVAVSRPLADRLRREGVPSDRLHVVPNAFVPGTGLLPRGQARELLGIDPDGFHVGWVGRIGHEKGPDVMVEAMRMLAGWPVSATMIGDGRLRARLEPAARGLSIRWAGAIDDAARLFTAFDAFVLSSRTEGTPMVLLEAMHAGVPIVATAVGGVPDVLDPESALLVPPCEPRLLAAAIDSIRLDPEAARHRATAAGRRLDDYSAADWVRRYAEVYEQAMTRNRPDSA